MKNQKGYTVVELLVVLIAIASIIGMCYGVYVAVHFINKFW